MAPQQQKVELLSPAGNLEKLKIAIAYGADAVYGSMQQFSLRSRSAKDFNLDSFSKGIEYAKKRGKKFYIPINSFPFNAQLPKIKDHLSLMASLKPDAFIITTPSVILLAKEVAPDIPIHLSTQANVLNYLDAQFYYDLGVKRIITAREIQLKDLEIIKKHIPNLELEIFVHGSMCFAFSGRCLLSALQSARIPNRGSCANDCRFPYKVYVENEAEGTLLRLEEEPEIGTYIFNAKDMNLASHVDKILSSGCIDSLKIEGRTKSVYYAGITALAYRQAIDDYYHNTFDANKYQKELHTTKHRGFTDAYLLCKPYHKRGTQKYDSSISTGTYEVAGIVLEDGEYFSCKYKIYPGDEIDIVLPYHINHFSITITNNDIGEIVQKNERYIIIFKQIITQKGKVLDSVHSGNVNPIKLPIKLPEFTFLRKQISNTNHFDNCNQHIAKEIV